MKRAIVLAALLTTWSCKQGSPDSATSGVLSDAELPGPEVFEGGPTAGCIVDGVKMTATFGPAGDFKWARLSDAPVKDGNPRVEYLRSDSSRVRVNGAKLVSGRWQSHVEGKDSVEVKVLLDQEPGDCLVTGYELTAEQVARR